MSRKNTTLAIALAALFVASMALPTAAAEPPSDPGDLGGDGPVGCVVEYFFNGWFIGNCLHDSTASPSETLECVGEHLKNGWFVGNCL